MTPLLNFRLKPLLDIIQDWEAGGYDIPNYLKGWFWLSYGWYWLETPQGDMPLGHPDFNTAFGYSSDAEPHLDYQVARFLMDWQEIMPDVLEPLPQPFAGWAESGAWQPWRQKIEAVPDGRTEPEWDVFFEARGWWSRRHLDMGYLVAPPKIHAWRVGETLTLAWDSRNKRVDGHLCWVEAHGQMPVNDWLREWADFEMRLETAMRERLHEVEALGILNAEQVASLWEQHGKYFLGLADQEKTDWDCVLKAVAQLEKWSGFYLPR